MHEMTFHLIQKALLLLGEWHCVTPSGIKIGFHLIAVLPA
jgi:hypothetical protein